MKLQESSNFSPFGCTVTQLADYEGTVAFFRFSNSFRSCLGQGDASSYHFSWFNGKQKGLTHLQHVRVLVHSFPLCLFSLAGCGSALRCAVESE